MEWISQIEAQKLTGKSRTTIKNLIKKIKESENNGSINDFCTRSGFLIHKSDVPMLLTHEKKGGRDPKVMINKDFILAYFKINGVNIDPMTRQEKPVQIDPMTRQYDPIENQIKNDSINTADYKDKLIEQLQKSIDDKSEQIKDLIKTKDELLKQSEQSNILLLQQGQKIIELSQPKKKKWFWFGK